MNIRIAIYLCLLLGFHVNAAADSLDFSKSCDTMNLKQLAMASRQQLLAGKHEQAIALHICALQRVSNDKAGVYEFVAFHNTFSATLRLIGASELSMEHARKGFRMGLHHFKSQENQKNRAKIVYANHLLLNGYADSALFYYRSACLTNSVPKGPGSCNNIGMAQAASEKHDSALFFFSSALRNMRKQERIGSWEMYLAISDNMVRSLWELNKLHTRPGLLDSFQQQCLQFGRPDRIVKYQMLFAEIALAQGLNEKAFSYLSKLSDTSFKSDSRQQDLKKYESLLAQFYLNIGNTEAAHKHATRLLHIKDSLTYINKAFLELLVKTQPYYQTATSQIESRLARAEVAQRESSIKQASLLKWLKTISAFALMSILAITIVTLYFRARHIKLQEEKKRISSHVSIKEQKLKELEKEIQLRKSDLEKFTLYLEVLEETRSDLKRTIEQSIKQKGEDSKNTLRALLRSDKVNDLMNQRSEVLFKNVETVSAGFYERLQSTFPNLSPAEVELCAYIRAGLTSNEIAQRRNIQTKSVRMTKYRLKKKLNLAESEDLLEFIRRL